MQDVNYQHVIKNTLKMAKIRGKYAPVSDFSILRGEKMSVYTTRRKQMIQCYKLIDLLQEIHSLYHFFFC